MVSRVVGHTSVQCAERPDVYLVQTALGPGTLLSFGCGEDGSSLNRLSLRLLHLCLWDGVGPLHALLTFLVVFLDFAKMYTNQQHSIAAAIATPSGSAAPAAAPSDRITLEPRSAAMLEGADVDVRVMDAFGKFCLRTLAVFTGLGTDDEKLRAFLKKSPIDLD